MRICHEAVVRVFRITWALGMVLVSPPLALGQSAAQGAGNTTPGTTTPADSASSLDERVKRLEAEIQELKKQQANASQTASPGQTAAPSASASQSAASNAVAANAATTEPAARTAADMQTPGGAAGLGTKWGTYTPGLGYKVVNTDVGDMSVSMYTYVRYLNQSDTDSTYTNAFGQVSSVQQSESFQILKVQIKFLGWFMSPKFRYFLYAWSSNASQGQGAQVVIAGNLNYTFNSYLTLSGGITSLPGTRSLEGNFPYWLSNDNRLITDEFFRPSYTSGIWARGELAQGVRYQAMLGNNLSQLGVASTQLPKHLDTWSSMLFWMPTTGEYGPGFSPGWGDFEEHEQAATRLGAHYTRSIETRQEQPNSQQFENTQIRLSDGTIIFSPNIFGPGVSISQLLYQMSSLDAGVKYRGYSLEGEYFWRLLSDFEGPGTAIIPNQHDRGFQLQASAMVIPRTAMVYLGGSRVSGNYGDPWDFRAGANWFPFKNQVVRWNAQVIRLYHSPVGNGSLPYNVGTTGWVFNTDFCLNL